MSEVAPSFFPTPHEIAGGIKWVREHPVVATAAAAAATAVSVITFLRARTLVDEDDEGVFRAKDEELPPNRPRFSTWADQYHSTREVPAKSKSSDDFTRHKDVEDVFSSTDSEVSTAGSHLTRKPSPASSSMLCELDDSPRAVSIPPTCMEDACLDSDDVSPQWGWYVSTTPPEEYYS